MSLLIVPPFERLDMQPEELNVLTLVRKVVVRKGRRCAGETGKNLHIKGTRRDIS